MQCYWEFVEFVLYLITKFVNCIWYLYVVVVPTWICSWHLLNTLACMKMSCVGSFGDCTKMEPSRSDTRAILPTILGKFSGVGSFSGNELATTQMSFEPSPLSLLTSDSVKPTIIPGYRDNIGIQFVYNNVL